MCVLQRNMPLTVSLMWFSEFISKFDTLNLQVLCEIRQVLNENRVCDAYLSSWINQLIVTVHSLPNHVIKKICCKTLSSPHRKYIIKYNYYLYSSDIRLRQWYNKGNAWLKLCGWCANDTYTALILSRNGSMKVFKIMKHWYTTSQPLFCIRLNDPIQSYVTTEVGPWV